MHLQLCAEAAAFKLKPDLQQLCRLQSSPTPLRSTGGSHRHYSCGSGDTADGSLPGGGSPSAPLSQPPVPRVTPFPDTTRMPQSSRSCDEPARVVSVENVLADTFLEASPETSATPSLIPDMPDHSSGSHLVEQHWPDLFTASGRTVTKRASPSQTTSTQDAARKGQAKDWPNLSGTWAGSRNETYEIAYSSADSQGTCVRKGPVGQTKTFTIRYDARSHALWWGVRWSHFLDLASLGLSPQELPWYLGSDHQLPINKRSRPSFTWHRPRAH